MGVYYYSRASVALNTANDLMTLISAASRRARLLWIEVDGMGTTSAAGEVAVNRSTGGTTGGGALTGQKQSTDLPTAASTVNTTWSAQPTLSGDPIHRLGVNQNGGINRFTWPADKRPEYRNGEQISVRPNVGSHNVIVTVAVEEDY